MPRDGLALALGQAEHLFRAAGRDMAVHESVHPHHAPHAGIAVQIAAEAFAAPIVAEEIVQQRCAYHRSGLVPGQTHPAGDGIGRFRHGDGMVIDRIAFAMVLKGAQLLETGMLQNIPGKLLDLAVHWTHPFLCFCLYYMPQVAQRQEDICYIIVTFLTIICQEADAAPDGAARLRLQGQPLPRAGRQTRPQSG